MKLARTDSKLTERHNRHVRAEKNKVYSDDHYHFTYNHRSGRWHGQNIDAERRNRRSEWGDMAGLFDLAIQVFFFLLILYRHHVTLSLFLSCSSSHYIFTTNINKHKGDVAMKKYGLVYYPACYYYSLDVES